MNAGGVAPLPRTVRVLAGVSLLTDLASEMIYPLLPIYLSTVLGIPPAVLGSIEGMAESVSSLLRLPAGWWSDRIGARKPFVLLGYALAAMARPLIGLAQSAGAVAAIRLTDRLGKGIRSAPRDALIADAVAPESRGRAFGFHRAADHFGAILGPLVAFVLLRYAGMPMRELFLWAALPGGLAVLLLVVGVRERPRAPRVAVEQRQIVTASLGAPFWRYLGVLFLFTLAASSDAFLLLRAQSLGVSIALIPILWAVLHVVKSSTSVIGGTLSDRLGRRPLILGGWLIYAMVYLGFGFATSVWQIWALFIVYGLYFGMTEGVEKAMVADLVPASLRGTAFGWFNAAVGLAAFPASAGFGLVWAAKGPSVAFAVAAGVALFATLCFALLVPVSSATFAPRSE